MLETFSPQDLEALAHDCLIRIGVDGEIAAAVAAEIAASEAIGAADHGLKALLRDIRLLRYGHIDLRAAPICERRRPGVLYIDAGHGFAAAPIQTAAPALAEIAQDLGVALLRIDRCSDPGAMLCAVERVAKDGMIAYAMTGARAAGFAHPDRPQAITIAAVPADLIAMSPALAGAPFGQPSDSPLQDRVNHSACLVAVHPSAVNCDAFAPALSLAQAAPAPAREIALAPDLLAEIIAA